MQRKHRGNENKTKHQDNNGITKIKQIYTLRPGVSSVYIFIIPALLPLFLAEKPAALRRLKAGLDFDILEEFELSLIQIAGDGIC